MGWISTVQLSTALEMLSDNEILKLYKGLCVADVSDGKFISWASLLNNSDFPTDGLHLFHK
jgi:hypothetical protein